MEVVSVNLRDMKTMAIVNCTQWVHNDQRVIQNQMYKDSMSPSCVCTRYAITSKMPTGVSKMPLLFIQYSLMFEI